MELLQMENITKLYGENRVLNKVSLSIREGEIHGLVGENGAGKSTLMNILFGMPVIHSTGGFEGEIFINGIPFNPKSPEDAMKAGIGMVHQEFMLIPGFSVTENIKLNRERTNPTLLSKIFGNKLERLDLSLMAKDSRQVLDKLNMTVDEYLPVAGLPVGYMQFIEIAREIDKEQLKLLILDEPTAVLTETEASQFLDVVRKLSEMGISILFISHRLDEIKEITHSITILRDGEMVKTIGTDKISIVDIARLMVGRNIDMVKAKDEERDIKDEYILELKDFKVNMPGEKVKGLDLKVRKGEILGIGGLAGQGKIGISNGIMGLYETSGTIIKDGKELPLNNPRNSLNSSIAFLSEDRRGVGLLLDDPIDFNIAFSSLEIQNKFLKKIGPFNLIDNRTVREHALKMIEELDIRCTGPKQHTRYLSGGNQQKVCIARALTLEPNLLLVSEPTRGIDIGAKKLVLDTLVKLNRELNMTIIITSSELGELRQISHRIAIIYDGKVKGILPPDASDEHFGLLMAGETLDKVVN
ncbi:ABC transporter-like protein [[Clostridium] ultunense Esp]|uniref:ABC transporter-like protein n=1 Tax=[Clostridium] ultunense Esp TaxID=1288971 RepID=M1Z945_9FIRM|nr:sugar ABC transporter ATP-binding protein [Schnuerera ultunensis]CCQ94621.1 ABC transporter-like protein [[Clostridium] ultunense Esp]SHD76706.1 ABC transporter-like protein [[Clostridium] ultunense Esp]